MKELAKYRTYLTFIALLMIAKFIWVPMWEDKEASWSEYNRLKKTKEKTEILVGLADEMHNAHIQARQLFDHVNKQVLTTDNITQFKLQKQVELNTLFDSKDIDVATLSWRDGIESNGIKQMYVDLTFSGKLKSFIEASSSLKEALKQVELSKLKLSIKGQTPESLGTFRGSLSVKLVVMINSNEVKEASL